MLIDIILSVVYVIVRVSALAENVYAAHLDNVALARNKLYKWKWKAENKPSVYCEVMIDGMTKGTTRLPRLRTKPKYWETKRGPTGGDKEFPYYDYCLMGSQIAGMPHYCDFFSNNISGDANGMVEIVHLNVARIQKHNRDNGLPNPSVMYVQLDNVSSNKSKLMFIYCSWLVATGVFTKIKLGFLLVGHTHEYIDQFFSRYAMFE